MTARDAHRPAHLGARRRPDQGLRHGRLRRGRQRRPHRPHRAQATVTVPGGPLSIEWRDDDHVIMTGPAEWEFSGTFDPQTGAWTRDRQDVA